MSEYMTSISAVKNESRLKNWAQVLGWALVAYFPLTGLTTLLPGFIDKGNWR